MELEQSMQQSTHCCLFIHPHCHTCHFKPAKERGAAFAPQLLLLHTSINQTTGKGLLLVFKSYIAYSSERMYIDIRSVFMGEERRLKTLSQNKSP